MEREEIGFAPTALAADRRTGRFAPLHRVQDTSASFRRQQPRLPNGSARRPDSPPSRSPPGLRAGRRADSSKRPRIVRPGPTRLGSIAARRIRKILGSRAGWKDLVVLAPKAVTVWLEVKAPKDPLLGTRRKTPLSREQKELIPKLQAWGHKVHVVYSVREVLDVLAGYTASSPARGSRFSNPAGRRAPESGPRRSERSRGTPAQPPGLLPIRTRGSCRSTDRDGLRTPHRPWAPG